MTIPQVETRIDRAAGLVQSLRQLLECCRDLDHPGAQLASAIFLATEVEAQLAQIKNPAPIAPISGANDA